MSDNTIPTVGVILALVAVIISVIAVAYVYNNQPETVDTSGINVNSNLIAILQSDALAQKSVITSLTSEIRNVQIQNIDQNDLDDLEDELQNDISDLDDDFEDTVRCLIDNWGNETEFENCLDDNNVDY